MYLLYLILHVSSMQSTELSRATAWKNQQNLFKMTLQRNWSSKEQRKRFAFILSLTFVKLLYKFKAIWRITAESIPLLISVYPVTMQTVFLPMIPLSISHRPDEWCHHLLAYAFGYFGSHFSDTELHAVRSFRNCHYRHWYLLPYVLSEFTKMIVIRL